MTQYGFIGTGSMGSMLIRKIIGSGLVTPGGISASSKSGISARALAGTTGITAEASNRSVAGNADVLFICVKPLEVRGVLDEVRDVLKPDALLVSIAGCVSLENLRDWAGENVHGVRVIPSVTAEENAGISLVAWGHGVTPGDKNLVLGLLNAISTAVEIDEQDFDLYTNLTSCGPALIVAMMREFAGAASRTGTIPPKLAEYLVKETMVGTARILEGGQETFDNVIGRVATKGGSTEEGVKVLETRLPDVMDEVLLALDAKRRVVAEKVAGE
ncbi:pyrroline-5-carboxylate reductase dimerization domain-containing protein [uncultured Methanoregula sp.]|uniref:pyrroline-5-carboxylate reductase family protein n=1 Tax=uncultured Methanoregula sp. TaxID=1005933 RepID=UPI002AABB713|nr:pyrroline-5-carboxylate reductase dimerization domain-containing protein [uncultured Methanoregula sp.]